MTSSSSIYSPFSDRVGLPPHNTPFPGVSMKSIGAAFLRPYALPDVSHMRGFIGDIFYLLSFVVISVRVPEGGVCVHISGEV